MSAIRLPSRRSDFRISSLATHNLGSGCDALPISLTAYVQGKGKRNMLLLLLLVLLGRYLLRYCLLHAYHDMNGIRDWATSPGPNFQPEKEHRGLLGGREQLRPGECDAAAFFGGVEQQQARATAGPGPRTAPGASLPRLASFRPRSMTLPFHVHTCAAAHAIVERPPWAWGVRYLH